MKIKTSCGPGLLIGLPTLGRPVPMEWAMTFKALNPPINYNTNHLIVYGKPVDLAREEIADEAVRQGHKYIFFLGDDVVPQSLNTLKQLIYRMEQNPEIGVVGGVYCSKSDPPAPLVFKENGRGSYWDWKVGEFFEVTGLGMDCTLIRVDILKDIPKPWFKTVDEDSFDEGQNQADMWTEDLYFLNKVKEHTEYKIFCDGSLLCDHWDVGANKKYNVPTDSLPMRRLQVNKSLKALDIGCGLVNIEQLFPEYHITRVDIDENVNPDYRCDIKLLPFGNESFDLIYSSHVLEHFGRKEWKAVLKEWLRVLKKDGKAVIVVPDISWAVDQFKADGSLNDIMNVFYGAQSSLYDRHYNGFWEERIRAEFKEFPLEIDQIEKNGYNLTVKATKCQ